MVFYHAFYILGYQFGFSFMEQAQHFFEPAQPFFACLFIFISGISSNLSHSNAARGAKLLVIALLFSVVTMLVLPRLGITGTEIQFGILHLLSVSMLLFALLRPLLEKVPTTWGMVLSVLLFAVFFGLPAGRLLWFDLPQSLYSNSRLFFLGFTDSSFYSADYFPLLPYFFMFIAGTFFGRLAANEQLPASWYKVHCKALDVIGRKTLIIYVAHWPIIFLLGLIISKI